MAIGAWNLFLRYFHRTVVRTDAMTPPLYLRIRSSKAFIISACVLAIFTDTFLYGIVSEYQLEREIGD